MSDDITKKEISREEILEVIGRLAHDVDMLHRSVNGGYYPEKERSLNSILLDCKLYVSEIVAYGEWLKNLETNE